MKVKDPSILTCIRLIIAGTVMVCSQCVPPESNTSPGNEEEFWAPGQTRPTLKIGPRGFLDVRGLIHAHSIYSHDACYEEPWLEDDPNAACLSDFRAGLCDSGHEFAFLTDHPDSFAEHDFPDVLLFDEQQGDTLHFRENNHDYERCNSQGQKPRVVPCRQGALERGPHRIPSPLGQFHCLPRHWQHGAG